MSDKIQDSYRQSRNIYDDVLTRSTWWSRVYMDLFWNGVDDNEIARKVLSYIPDNFAGKLLDVPVGTGVFTAAKYVRMNRADIICLDYSQDMLKQARVRFRQERIGNCRLIQGDVGALPFGDNTFDIVLSMNGFHAFPDKEKAYSETRRVLKEGGTFCGCFYVRGCCRRTDWMIDHLYVPRGFFTPPFETMDSLEKRLRGMYSEVTLSHVQSIAVFRCRK